jgi:hypothetical protein
MLDREGLQREVINLVPIAITRVAYRYIKLKYLIKNIDSRNVLDGVNALSAIGSKKAGVAIISQIVSQKNPLKLFI